MFSFRPTNSFSRDDLNYEKGEVKNIHYGDIHTTFNSLLDVTKERIPYINEHIILKIAKDNYCLEGDLVIADASEDYNDIGKCVEITNLNNEKVVAGLHTLLARPNLHKMEIGFSNYLMKSWEVRLQTMRIAQGTKVLGISAGNLSKINLVIPSEAEQKKIAYFLTTMFSSIDENIRLANLKVDHNKILNL